MASNFKVSVSRKRDRLDLKLAGDFDGTSACELLNALKDNCDGVVRVMVNTNGLKEIHPFGQDTFQKNLYQLKDQPFRLVFTGEKATRIAPERNRFF